MSSNERGGARVVLARIFVVENIAGTATPMDERIERIWYPRRERGMPGDAREPGANFMNN